jgi:SagB-type dehydrogenase family enzyme
MSRRNARSFVLTLGILLAVAAPAAVAQTPPALQAIPLPAPRQTGGKPLLDALAARHSTREFEDKDLPPQLLSDLLWAAFGINRPDGRRTAPSAMNWQEVDVYVVTAAGVYVYDPQGNALSPVAAGDHRAATGMQPFVATAPLNLVYVADAARAKRASDADRQLYMGADTAFIAENVYLFCASAGLATVVRGSVQRDELAKVLQLRPEQQVVLAQTVGYPK